MSKPLIFLVRHGETEWSITKRHTGKTDIPLTENGCKQAERLAPVFKGMTISKVFSSPRIRTLKTCQLAGFHSGQIIVDQDLAEWDYGAYEGLKTPEILKLDPQWTIFTKGAPQGETVAQVSLRADRALNKLKKCEGNIVIFSHGHFGRVLGARWIGLPAADGQLFSLSPASLSLLGYEHDFQVFSCWNTTCHLK
jgi:probable phosphoglycerate mutase